MRQHSTILLLAVAAATMLQTGCGSNGGGKPTSGGSGDAKFATYTLLSSGGVWPNAIVNANADPYTVTCDVYTDKDCVTGYQNYSTGSIGEFIWSTDALPATWYAAAQPDANCSYGGSSGPQSITNDGWIDVTCGQLYGTGAGATPASCTIVYVNGVQQGFCPPYLEINTTDPVLPTSYALTAGLYSDEGGSEGSYQETASSSTQIRVPAPTNWGLSVITVTDPNSNEVLGAADYILHECIIQTGPNGTQENCPY
jgi:hypothetical protein